MKKRIFSMLIAFCLLVTAICTADITTSAVDKYSKSYTLYLGETQVTKAKPSGTNWSFDATTDTLTLNNFTYSGAGYNNYAGIYASGSLNIVLKGTNTIELTSSSEGDSHGIYISNGSLTISGDGSLTVKSGTAPDGSTYGIKAAYSSRENPKGSSGHITIKSGTITAIAQKDAYTNCVGIYADKNLKILGGNVTTKLENVEKGETPMSQIGIYGKSLIEISGGNISSPDNKFALFTNSFKLLSVPKMYSWKTSANAEYVCGVITPFSYSRSNKSFYMQHISLEMPSYDWGTTAPMPKVLNYLGSGKITYTFYTDKEMTKKTNSENGALAEGLQPTNVGTYYLKANISENGNYPEYDLSTSFAINKIKKSQPVNLIGTPETIDGKADGIISGVDSTMEYRKDNETLYSKITSSTLENLADGTYYIRYAKTQNYDESECVSITLSNDTKIAVTVPKNQVGYKIETDKSQVSWNESVKISFELKSGYSKLENFAVKVNGEKIELTENSYEIKNIKADTTITVDGVADVTKPKIEGVETDKIYCGKITAKVIEENLESVVLNGEDAVIDADGQLVLTPQPKKQTLTVTDTSKNTVTVSFTINDTHTYDWKNDGIQYWKKCKYCDDETAKQDIPTIKINGEDSVCKTVDYKFTFNTPNGVISPEYSYDFGLFGSLGDNLTVDNGFCSGVVSKNLYRDSDKFELTVYVETIDGFTVKINKTVNIKHKSLNHFEAKSATDDSEGNIEYWYCKDCDKFFSDKDGINEIKASDIVIKKLEYADNINIADNNNSLDNDKQSQLQNGTDTNAKTSPKTSDAYGTVRFWFAVLVGGVLACFGKKIYVIVCSQKIKKR